VHISSPTTQVPAAEPSGCRVQVDVCRLAVVWNGRSIICASAKIRRSDWFGETHVQEQQPSSEEMPYRDPDRRATYQRERRRAGQASGGSTLGQLCGAHESLPRVWRYLPVSESDVRTARGSWEALKGLGGP
jgi:hypothetical protein